MLIPLVIMGFIRVLADGYTPDRSAEQAQLQILQEQVQRQHAATPRRARKAAPSEAIPAPGTYEIQQIQLDGAPVSWMPSPLMIAGTVGGGLAALGVAGTLMMLRRAEDEPELAAAGPRSSSVLVDEFYGDDEIRDLVASHERR